MRSIRITHILPGLDTGGAEMVLTRLVGGMDPLRFENRVISMTGTGVLGEHLRDMGIDVRMLGMGRVPGPLGMARLISQLRRDDPDVVQTWLYAADLVGGLAARSVGLRNVVWNLRQRAPQRHEDPWRHRWTARACATVSALVPHAILACSDEARRSHESFGYPRSAVVVPNGFDVEVFRPDPQAAASVRAELGIQAETPLVGMVARLDPVKGHRDFLEAATRMSRYRPDVHFVLCGDGVVAGSAQLARCVRGPELDRRVHLIGRRSDVPRLLAALDVFVSPSHSEGFPNAIGEAMASSVPCVVTDVGASASLVGATGTVVPARSPHLLADGIVSLLALDPEGRAAIGRAARRRIEAHYSIPAMVEHYSRFYEGLVQPVRERQPTCRS